MKNSIKAWIIFRRILCIFFLFFLINYFQAENSNNLLTKKTILTEKQIKEFEKDVKEGKFVDIKDYTSKNKVDTSNNISNFGYFCGETITDFFGVKVVDFIEFIGNFVS